MKAITLTCLATAMILAGAAFSGSADAQPAQKGSQASGTTSGPASGTNVEPSAATQKKGGASDAASVSAGAPGKEGVKGGESGQNPRA